MCRERAFAEARAAEMALRAGQDLGLLHGIPYVAKDLGAFEYWREHDADRDVERIRALVPEMLLREPGEAAAV